MRFPPESGEAQSLDGDTVLGITGTLRSRCVAAEIVTPKKKAARGRPFTSRARRKLLAHRPGGRGLARHVFLRLARELLGLVDRLLHRGAELAFLLRAQDLAVAGVDEHFG